MATPSARLSRPRVRLLVVYVMTLAVAFVAARQFLNHGRLPAQSLAVLGVILALLAGASATSTA